MWQKYIVTSKNTAQRIQTFKRLIHWFHFDLVRDTLITVEKFVLYSAAEFLCERKSSIFCGDGRNNVAFSIGKSQLRTPIERVAFSDCSRIETHVCHSNNQNTMPPLPLNRFFLPPRFWVVKWPVATIFPNDQWRQRAEGRGPGNDVVF